MKLLILIHSLSSGGAERVTANLANYWAIKGWTITVVSMTSVESDFYELDPRVRRIGLGMAGESSGVTSALSSNFSRVRALKKLIREVQPDVALGMMTAASVILAIANATSFKKIKVIGSEHVDPSRMPLGRVWEALRAYWYGKLDAVAALTEQSAQWLRANTAAKSIAVIPNAVMWPLPTQSPVKQPFDFVPTGANLLLAVGRLGHEKGFDILIDVFSRLANRLPHWHLVILGEGGLRGELERQIKAFGLENRISMPGLVGNLGDWYKTADIYVMTSRYEGFGNTLIEAMAHGCAVVSFDCDSGPRNIIQAGQDGLLIPAEDTDSLEQALSRLMIDEADRSSLAAKAVDVRSRFSFSCVAGMWERLFASNAAHG